jgi:hypothetical protein
LADFMTRAVHCFNEKTALSQELVTETVRMSQDHEQFPLFAREMESQAAIATRAAKEAVKRAAELCEATARDV